MLRLDQVHVIRHKVLVEKQSMRSVAEEMGVSRNTVRKYLTEPEPVRKEADPRPRPVMERVEGRLRALLADRRLTAGKQRWTAPRLAEVLASEGLAASERTVRRCMAEWRRKRAEVYVPLVYRPGELAEVDFFEVLAGPPEERRKAQMFVMREMHAGWDVAVLYERADQVSFLDGHVRAFALLGGVPQRIAYDNLKAAVVRVLVGSERELTERFQALASHYLFEPVFARPGEGHDKGGVEARGKGVRLRHLTPIPQGTDLEAITTTLQGRLGREAEAKQELVDASRAGLLPLPAYPFQAARVVFAPVSSQASVRLETATYSVPEEWARSQVEVHIGARDVTLLRDGQRFVHRRVRGNQRSIWYPHYLRELSRKPQALRQVAPELMAQLGEPFAALWRQLVLEHGELEAARLYKPVLRAIKQDGMEPVRMRLAAAIHEPQPLLALLGEPGPRSCAMVVPFALQGVEIAATPVSSYDILLAGAP